MISFDLQNLWDVSPTHGLRLEDIVGLQKKLSPFLHRIHEKKQGFYRVIDDTQTIRRIEQFAKAEKNKWNDIVVLAIGGSSLGTLCLQQSLTHLFQNQLPKQKVPRLHVLDNIDPALMRDILDIITLKKTLCIVVTKSGATPETLAQYFYFRKLYDTKKLSAKKHFVFVTDPEKGFLRSIAKEEGITTFDIPTDVGGRFSVQTAVGLLPAALIGVNIRKLLAGCKDMRDSFISTDASNNLPFTLATIQYLLHQKGKAIHVLMPYTQKLIKFADWYRQLLAESIGKARNNDGAVVNVGITPINALGVTDQHSQSQLYNEGPNDKFFLFIDVKKRGNDVRIPVSKSYHEQISFLHGLSFNTLMGLEKRGTADAYTKNDRPNITITIDEVNEYALGQLFMLFEGATAFLGEFYNINAFDQPGVELSKNLTRDYARQLQKKSKKVK